jgi:RNase adapter protein RapZ
VSDQQQRIVVITGMSGSGKSTAIRALEDAGFFCIDNLPVLLLPKLTELAGFGNPGRRLALVIDAREGVFLREAPRMLDDLRRAGRQVEVLFLDSSNDALTRRFSETRRRHPLAPHETISEGIERERSALHDLREVADQVIDTSDLTVHDLKKIIHERFSAEQSDAPSISVLSFGYRYGVPPQADLVFDVRFLPNPYFVPEMKGLTGKHPQVARFVLDRPDAQAFLDKVVDLCRFLFPRYHKEGKSYLTIALGCTGGKHRSVSIARELYQRLSRDSARVQLWDRDVDKE